MTLALGTVFAIGITIYLNLKYNTYRVIERNIKQGFLTHNELNEQINDAEKQIYYC